jgi:hypothetical protein
MLIRPFRSNHPSAFIFLPLLAVAIWIAGFTEPLVLPVKHTMPLYELIASPLLTMPWLGTTLALLLVVGEAFLLNYIINENEVLPKQSFLPALFYILLISNNNAMLSLHPLLPANLFLLFGINRLMCSYRKDHAFSHAFDAGFLFAIASLFYFPYAVFFPLLGVALLIMRPFIWREWLISFFGVLIPYIFTTVVYFWKEELDYLYYDKIFFPIIRQPLRVTLPPEFYVLAALGCLIFLLALSRVLTGVGSGPQKTKKGIVLLVWVFIFAGAGIFISPELSTRYFSALAIPGAVFYAYYFLTMKKDWLAELLCLLFVGTLTVNLVLHYF